MIFALKPLFCYFCLLKIHLYRRMKNCAYFMEAIRKGFYAPFHSSRSPCFASLTHTPFRERRNRYRLLICFISFFMVKKPFVARRDAVSKPILFQHGGFLFSFTKYSYPAPGEPGGYFRQIPKEKEIIHIYRYSL